MKDTIRVRPLRPYEKIKLRRLKRQRRNTVNSRNARIIMLSSGHMRNAPIAELVGCTATWVRQIIHRFNDAGIEAFPIIRGFKDAPHACLPATFVKKSLPSRCLRRSRSSA